MCKLDFFEHGGRPSVSEALPYISGYSNNNFKRAVGGSLKKEVFIPI